MRSSGTRPPGTKEKIATEGKALLQKHGYNGFSFQDIADKLKLKKPSLYDHYPSKDHLIVAIVREYGARFEEWAISARPLPPIERIRKIFDVFHAFASDKGKVCPVLALAADFQGLSKEIQKEVGNFVGRWLSWLEEQIKDGQRLGQIRPDWDSKAMATFIYSQGMGSQFQSRIKGDPELTSSSGDLIVSIIGSSGNH